MPSCAAASAEAGRQGPTGRPADIPFKGQHPHLHIPINTPTHTHIQIRVRIHLRIGIHTCMDACMHTHIHAQCVYTYTNLYLYINSWDEGTRLYIKRVDMCTYKFVCASVHMYIYIHTHIHVCMYVCMYLMPMRLSTCTYLCSLHSKSARRGLPVRRYLCLLCMHVYMHVCISV